MLHALTLTLAMSSASWCGGGGGCCIRVQPIVAVPSIAPVSSPWATDAGSVAAVAAMLAMPKSAWPAMLPLIWKSATSANR